ncbi:MAG: DUF3987 domain-containing protein [Christensenellales bacterium]
MWIKTREAESILHPTLSAILTIQPSVLEEIMDNTTMSGRGLLARFLYSFPPSRIGTRTFRSTPIPADVNAAYRKMVFDLMNIQRPAEPKTLALSAEAGMVLDEYFGTHERYLVGEGQAIADWASKYIGTVLRIAGLLHAAELNGEDRPSISVQTMNRAIRICAYFLAHAQYAYSMMGTDLCIQKAKFVMAKLTKKTSAKSSGTSCSRCAVASSSKRRMSFFRRLSCWKITAICCWNSRLSAPLDARRM